jgi:hypothetical protein
LRQQRPFTVIARSSLPKTALGRKADFREPDRKALKNFKLQINDLRPPQLDLAHIDQVDRTRRMVLSKSGVIMTGGLNLSRG